MESTLDTTTSNNVLDEQKLRTRPVLSSFTPEEQQHAIRPDGPELKPTTADRVGRYRGSQATRQQKAQAEAERLVTQAAHNMHKLQRAPEPTAQEVAAEPESEQSISGEELVSNCCDNGWWGLRFWHQHKADIMKVGVYVAGMLLGIALYKFAISPLIQWIKTPKVAQSAVQAMAEAAASSNAPELPATIVKDHVGPALARFYSISTQ